MGNIPKIIFAMIGGAVGWIVEEFQPTFPLVIVAVVFILYDAFTAYQLDKRVHKKYPDETQRHEAKFTSFAFGKVISHTIRDQSHHPEAVVADLPGIPCRALGIHTCKHTAVIHHHRRHLL